ncbi:PRDM4-like protein [Mya arenaria]|uniref:PRDM4-like protein n=1 Tax=Mya arenaria TaxID=6604 RepID=A0ABY7ES18_MYAAR|nr:PRDM4-like protein [Mya arenaria]
MASKRVATVRVQKVTKVDKEIEYVDTKATNTPQIQEMPHRKPSILSGARQGEEVLEPIESGKKSLRHICSVCEKTFRSECGKRFRHSSTLKKHGLSHSGERNHPCEVCGKSFQQKGHLKAHMITHTKEKKFECSHPGCNRKFGLRKNLTYHEGTHSQEKNFECHHCKKLFARRDQCQGHIIRSHMDKSEKITCENCGQKYSTKFSLDRHIKSHCPKQGQAKMDTDESYEDYSEVICLPEGRKQSRKDVQEIEEVEMEPCENNQVLMPQQNMLHVDYNGEIQYIVEVITAAENEADGTGGEIQEVLDVGEITVNEHEDSTTAQNPKIALQRQIIQLQNKLQEQKGYMTIQGTETAGTNDAVTQEIVVMENNIIELGNELSGESKTSSDVKDQTPPANVTSSTAYTRSGISCSPVGSINRSTNVGNGRIECGGQLKSVAVGINKSSPRKMQIMNSEKADAAENTKTIVMDIGKKMDERNSGKTYVISSGTSGVVNSGNAINSGENVSFKRAITSLIKPKVTPKVTAQKGNSYVESETVMDNKAESEAVIIENDGNIQAGDVHYAVSVSDTMF